MFFPIEQRVVDHETYIFNLETANVLGQSHRPSYFKYYTAKKDLEMENLFPMDYDKLARAQCYKTFFCNLLMFGIS